MQETVSLSCSCLPCNCGLIWYQAEKLVQFCFKGFHIIWVNVADRDREKVEEFCSFYSKSSFPCSSYHSGVNNGQLFFTLLYNWFLILIYFRTTQLNKNLLTNIILLSLSHIHHRPSSKFLVLGLDQKTNEGLIKDPFPKDCNFSICLL